MSDCVTLISSRNCDAVGGPLRETRRRIRVSSGRVSLESERVSAMFGSREWGAGHRGGAGGEIRRTGAASGRATLGMRGDAEAASAFSGDGWRGPMFERALANALVFGRTVVADGERARGGVYGRAGVGVARG